MGQSPTARRLLVELELGIVIPLQGLAPMPTATARFQEITTRASGLTSLKRSKKMYKFNVSKKAKGYAVQQQHDDQSVSFAPRKPFPTHEYTAEKFLEFMFKPENADSHFVSERVPE
jgi:hypothetical protein